MQSARSTATHALRITRTFPASVDRVFAAFTEPDLLKQWWGPAGFSLPSATVDLRVGGGYRFGMQPPQGEVMYLVGTFKEIERPRRLVYTWAWEGAPQSESLVTIDLREVDGDTEVVITQQPFADERTRIEHVKGWEGGLDRLQSVLRRK